ncbi:MAG: adenosylmethionine decarboxylase [Phycisphaerae bacterium]
MKESTLASTAYCGQSGDVKFAGIHLIVELWGARHMTDPQRIKEIMTEAVDACGATLLSIDLHVFSPGGGVSGVAVLSESHISIHTWPEFAYAAMDIFVCGTLDPHKTVPVLREGFRPDSIQVMEIKRGVMTE